MLYFLEQDAKVLVLNIKRKQELVDILRAADYRLVGFALFDLSILEQKFKLTQLESRHFKLVLPMHNGTNSNSSFTTGNLWQASDEKENEKLKEFAENQVRKQLEVHNIIEYIQAIRELSSLLLENTGTNILPTVFYRGQRDSDWNLTPSLLRGQPRFMNVHTDWEQVLSQITVTFEKQIHPYLDKPLEERDLLALGQHNGLPTNLLDWTINPLIALYFACKDEKDEKSSALGGAVWMVTSKFNTHKEGVPGEFFRPRVVSRFIEAQRGWFSAHHLPESSGKFEPIRSDYHPASWNSLIKISIPEQVKKSMVFELKNLGIDESSVFPSLGGIARDIYNEINP